MILQIDAGNSRVKWRIVGEAATINHARSGFVEAIGSSMDITAGVCREIEALGISDITRIQVANVRGDIFQRALCKTLEDRFCDKIEVAVPTTHCAGVRNGYTNPELLGVDRWLAMIAAFNHVNDECWVVGCGTTITLDVVDKYGNHLGGHILPGIHLMREALLNKSPRLISEEPFSQNYGLGTNTSDAINRGVSAILVGYLGFMRSNFRNVSSDAAWCFFGGDGNFLRELSGWGGEYRPELVLDGLSLAMP